MEKQQKHLLTGLILLAVLVGIYFITKEYTAGQTEKKEAEEAAAEIYLTDYEVGDVTAFSYQYEGENISFSLGDDGWMADSAPELSIDTDKIETLLGNINHLLSEREIQTPEDLGTYGLQEPSNIISVTLSTGEAAIYHVGDFNDILSEYYFQIEGDDHVYTVSSDVISAFEKSAEDFAV